MNKQQLNGLLDEKEDLLKWGGGTRQALRELADEYDKEVSLQHPVASFSTSKVVDKFLASKKAVGLAEASLRSYRAMLKPFIKQSPLLPTEPEEIDKFLAGRPQGTPTVRCAYTALKLMYDFANARLGATNPMCQISKPHQKSKEPQAPHTLRHTFGTLTTAAGLDTYSCARLLRHRVTQRTPMTSHYIHLNLEDLREKLERYSPLRLLGKGKTFNKTLN